MWRNRISSSAPTAMSWIPAREKAKALQGAKFDLRQFHQILLDGAMPLTILENLIEERAKA